MAPPPTFRRELRRRTRHRQRAASLHRPGSAPAGRSRRDFPRQGRPRLGRSRQGIHRSRRRPVVRRARFRQRASGAGRGQPDAQAAILPRLHRQVARADDRPGGDADRPRAGADEQGVLRQLRLRGQRLRHQDGLVPEQRARPAAEEEDHRPAEGLSRHHHRVGVADRAAGEPSQLRRAAAGLPPHHDAAFLPRRAARRVRGRVRHALRRRTGEADPRRGAGHGRRDVGRTDHGRRRRDPAARGLFPEDPGGAAQIRRAAGRRRGDLRLLAHRQLLGQPDARHQAGHPGLRQGAVVVLSADQRGDGE